MKKENKAKESKFSPDIFVTTGLAVAFSLSSFFYRAEFIRWSNIPLTYTFFALTIILPALTGFYFRKGESKKKRVLWAVIPGAVTGGLSFLTTVIINNVIGHGQLAKEAVAAALCLTFVLYLIELIILNKKNPARVISAFTVMLLIAACFFGKSYVEEKRMNARVPDPIIPEVSGWARRDTITDADFYISPDGDDSSDGSREAPFATFERAAQAVRETDKSGRKGITVGVFPGEYRTKGLSFTQEDSGTAECPVRYAACEEGECVINCGVSLKPGDFKAVSDQTMLSRLQDEAKKNVLCIDLKEYGITAGDYGKIYAIGSYNTAAHYSGDWVGPLYCELFVNDRRMTLARYPDEGFLETKEALVTGEGLETDGSLTRNENFEDSVDPKSDVYPISSKLADRISSWKTLDDVWMMGYWKYDWADASTPIGEFDPAEKTLSPKFVSIYGTKGGAPYYFFNVFEELDAPGEWYLDRENSVLYVYPDGDFSSSQVDLSLGLGNVISCENTSFLTFEGFTLKGTRGDAVSVTGESNTLRKCVIKNVAGNAVTVSGSGNLVAECEITRTGKGGIILDGGDRETLTSGDNRADNNLIHDWSEIYLTYQPAVTLSGVGNVCSHNEIYNSPHEAIAWYGNNHVIEYNIVHDVCLLSDDAGMLYSGRRWDWYGSVIRYNLLYNAGSGDHRPNGIYWDDALSGQTAYGNLLINIPQCGFVLGGGRDLTVQNNIIVNCNDKPISYDQRAIDGVFGGWFVHSSEENGDMWQRLDESPAGSGVWDAAYPQMKKFSRDFSDTDNPCFVPNPAFSTVSCNVIVNLEGDVGPISEKAAEYSYVDCNFAYKKSALDDIFENYRAGDYSLKQDSPVFEQIPDFAALPLDDMGRYAVR